MLAFDTFNLDNGLKVIISPDHSTPFVVVNVIYDVGARDEDPKRTGFAHLFEHLMFAGSKHAPSFDKPLERAGATNNAFTSNDVTNYYDIIPRENLETALWLESDRMSFLNVNEKSLEVQRKVVIEEFKERYLNKPYGQAWHELRSMAYHSHPYQWPTIGRTVKEIEEASLEDVQAFYNKFYHPNNAVLTLCGNISMDDKPLIEKWFGSLEAGPSYQRNLPQEKEQTEERRNQVEDNVPIQSVYIAFPMPGRGQDGYYACDLLSDLLSNGKSARLHQELVKQQQTFTEINAFVLGSFDPGLFVITGKPNDNVSQTDAEQAIWEVLEKIKAELPEDKELQKVKNKVEANLIYQLIEPTYQALNLAFFELMGNAEGVNHEHEKYQAVSLKEIESVANQLFKKEKSNTLWIIPSQKSA